jgi:centrosomal protein CEP135
MDSTLQSNVSSISEQKYINLRKRLDQLGYRQTLGIESLPLIEKLFNDLVHTTESLKKAKLDGNKTAVDNSISLKSNSDASFSTSNIQAYKTDNAKLIKENNELHIEFIKVKEDYETKLKGIYRLILARL